MTTGVGVVTAPAVMVKLAVRELAPIVTDEGTEATAGLLLLRFITAPAGGAPPSSITEFCWLLSPLIKVEDVRFSAFRLAGFTLKTAVVATPLRVAVSMMEFDEATPVVVM